MASLFEGIDDVLCRFLRIGKRNDLNHKTRVLTISAHGSAALLKEVYGTLESNYRGAVTSPSQELWACRHAPKIIAHNRSRETMLEKAVALLAQNRHLDGWFNQCPVASGIVDPAADRRRAVDLVHLSDGAASLVELKWGESNTPAYALFEVLEYGLAYLFARAHQQDFGLARQPVMSVRHVTLEVVAPPAFFARNDQRALFAQMNTALADFAQAQTNRTWSMSLEASAFPDWFAGWFTRTLQNGHDITTYCGSKKLTAEGRKIREAFDGRTRIGKAGQ